MRLLLVLPALLGLSACSTVDSEWLKNESGNQLKVTSGRRGDSRFVVVENRQKTWNGVYQGGKEKIPARKAFLMRMAKSEAARICGGPGAYFVNGEPGFHMQDSSPEEYGGGLLGCVISDIMTKDENIPVSVTVSFRCNNERNAQKLVKRG